MEKSLKNIEIELAHNPAITLLANYKNMNLQGQMHIIMLSVMLRARNTSMSRYYGIYTNEHHMCCVRKGSCVICYNMDGTRGENAGQGQSEGKESHHEI